MVTLENRSVDGVRTSLWRSRWAAIGAAVAVSLGAGGMFVAQAAPGPAESTIVSVTPERILDTRDPVNLGLAGPFVSPVSQKLKVTGSIPTATGTKIVVPDGATGVLLNVTAVVPTANGFISIRPGDATGAASTSSLNFNAGAVVPNSVQVPMPTGGANAGQIDITFDAYGAAGPTTDILIDVVGYTTNTGLQQLVADVATKANNAEVAALPGAHIIAAGRVHSNGTQSPVGSVELGTWSVTKTTPGVYKLVIPGGCGNAGSDWSLVQLSLGFNETSGEVVLGGGNCATGTVTWTVTTSNSAGVATDKNWQFMALGENSALPVAGALAELTDVPADPCLATTVGCE